jgi:hypothetical protein
MAGEQQPAGVEGLLDGARGADLADQAGDGQALLAGGHGPDRLDNLPGDGVQIGEVLPQRPG